MTSNNAGVFVLSLITPLLTFSTIGHEEIWSAWARGRLPRPLWRHGLRVTTNQYIFPIANTKNRQFGMIKKWYNYKYCFLIFDKEIFRLEGH